jgi:hypothetical protein
MLLTQLYVKVGILLTCRKHLRDPGVPWESDDVIKLAGEADRSASIDFQGLYLFNGDAYKARGKEEIEHEGKDQN